jgi:low temperature requirement protein LtrA
MWWLYFGREERQSQARLEQIPADRRPRVAVYSFGHAYFVIILGIAVAAVGMEKAIDSFHHPSHGLPAVLLPLGTSLFLVGLAGFHRTLSGTWPRAPAVGRARRRRPGHSRCVVGQRRRGARIRTPGPARAHPVGGPPGPGGDLS